MQIEWLTRKVDPSEFDELERKWLSPEMDLGKWFNNEMKRLPFGRDYFDWVTVRRIIESGERKFDTSITELWEFNSGRASFVALAGRAGFCSVRTNKRFGDKYIGSFVFVTSMS